MTATLFREDLRRPFGDEASRYTARLPETLSVIASGLDHAALAVAAAADLRRRGIMFYAAPLIEDQRALKAQIASGSLLVEFGTVDERRTAFDALAIERSASQLGCQNFNRFIADPEIHVLRDLIIMSDAVLARSSVGAAAIGQICGYRRRFYAIAPGVDVDVPDVTSERRDSIVVWAPRLPAERLGVIAMALDMCKSNVIFVCASGQLRNVRGSFVSAADGSRSLATAGCIVDASISDPSSAIALARIGVPLVSSSTSGVSEFVSGTFEYDPWNFRSIHAAVCRARGAEAPLRRRSALPVQELHETLLLAAPPPLTSGPLVSVVLPTFNRRSSLAKCLDCIAAQTYKDLDVIVVNDGGADVSDVCEKFPFVRLLSLDENVGPPQATKAGMNMIKGEYFCFWADDDWYFPDHFSRIVYALEMSGGAVAHTNTLTRYYLNEPDGSEKTRAYKILHERPNDPVEMMTGPTMSLGSILFRCEVVNEIGIIDGESGVADTEYQLRASLHYDFIAVDAVTVQWNYNVERSTFTHQMGEARFVRDFKAMYSKYPSALACVNDRRARWLTRVTDTFNSVIWPPDVYLPESFVD